MELADAVAGADYRIETWDAERHSRERFELLRGGDVVGNGTYFTGTRDIQPWIELHLERAVDPGDERHRQLFDALAAVLEPGSHLMVHYLGTTTAEALTADVPPPATPLGALMWQAGFRWFKDWYFTEGWMEGSQKLQGNLPVDADTKQEREDEARDALEAFLQRETGFDQCRERAQEVLEQL